MALKLPPRRLVLLAAFGILVAVAVWTIDRAQALRFREAGLALLNPANDAPDRLRDFHPLLKYRDELALYFFAREVDTDPRALAKNQLLLGIFYATRDCDRAQFYLRAAVATTGGDPTASKLLEQIKRDGCEGATPPDSAPRLRDAH